MADINMPRLSPDNITDPLLRSRLYKEIQAGGDDWPAHEVQPDEVLMPELIAHRHYGTATLKWVILIAARLDDIRESLESGSTLRLPTPVWLRQRIRYYQQQEAIER